MEDTLARRFYENNILDRMLGAEDRIALLEKHAFLLAFPVADPVVVTPGASSAGDPGDVQYQGLDLRFAANPNFHYTPAATTLPGKLTLSNNAVGLTDNPFGSSSAYHPNRALEIIHNGGVGTDSLAAPEIAIESFSDGSEKYPTFSMWRSMGGGAALTAGAMMGRLAFRGNAGTLYAPLSGANIDVFATNAFTGTNQGTTLRISVSPENGGEDMPPVGMLDITDSALYAGTWTQAVTPGINSSLPVNLVYGGSSALRLQLGPLYYTRLSMGNVSASQPGVLFENYDAGVDVSHTWLMSSGIYGGGTLVGTPFLTLNLLTNPTDYGFSFDTSEFSSIPRVRAENFVANVDPGDHPTVQPYATISDVLNTNLNADKWDSQDYPLTTLGDLLYGGASGVASSLAANATATNKFLRSVSGGAPSWETLAAGDIPDISATYATKTYAESLIVGLLDDRGNYDASGNAFPSSGGSGTAGAILKGDLWTISVAGTLGGHAVTPGDLVRALVDTPGSTDSNWAITENNIGYVAENQSNKVTSISGASTDVQYPSAKLTYDQLALKADVGQTMYIGTTALAINRASAALSLTGITSIDGSAATLSSPLPVANIAPGTAQYQYLVIGPGAGFVPAWSAGFLNITAAKTMAFPNSLTISGTDGSTLALAVTTAKTLTLTAVDNYNLTVPETGTAFLATGIAGGQTGYGGTAANESLRLHGTSHATKTTSHLTLQESGGLVSIGTATPDGSYRLTVEGSGVLVNRSVNALFDAFTLKNINTGTSAGVRTGLTTDKGTIYFESFGTNFSVANWAGKGGLLSSSAMGGMVFSSANTIQFDNDSAVTKFLFDLSTGKLGVGVTPTARLHLAAGTATANTAPLKFNTGTNLTAAEAGAMEYNNTFHLTNSDATRRHVVTAPNTTKVTAAAPYTNDGYVTMNIGGTDFKIMTTA